MGGKEVGGKEVGGKEVVGKEVGGKKVGGKEVGGKEVGGKEVGGKEVGGKEVCMCQGVCVYLVPGEGVYGACVLRAILYSLLQAFNCRNGCATVGDGLVVERQHVAALACHTRNI